MAYQIGTVREQNAGSSVDELATQDIDRPGSAIHEEGAAAADGRTTGVASHR